MTSLPSVASAAGDLSSAGSRRDNDAAARTWDCADILSDSSSSNRYALLILNQPIVRADVFRKCWQASSYRICADGGANRLYDHLLPNDRSCFLPDAIKGDLDSIRTDVLEYYTSLGIPVKQDKDEYSTDLMKSISEIQEVERRIGRELSIVIFGGLSGRVDQTVHTMSLLQKHRQTRRETYVVSEESLAWVLDEGSHSIAIDHHTMGQTCGMLPVGIESAHVISKGLKWDVDWITSLGGDVSTSNHLLPENPTVFIQTSRPILCAIVDARWPSSDFL